MPDQIKDDGLQLIASRLKPGGKALLSGSLESLYTDLFELVKKVQHELGAKVTFEELYSTPDPYNQAYGGHYAIILEKNR